MIAVPRKGNSFVDEDVGELRLQLLKKRIISRKITGRERERERESFSCDGGLRLLTNL
jgi:hypothetical protein